MLKKKVRKGIISLLCASILTIGAVMPVHAETIETNSQFTAVDGTVYDYYLDEVGNPYIMIDNEKCYVALPLEHLRVTDPEKIAELNECLTSSQTRALPSSYVDISQNGAEVVNSTVYTRAVNFDETPTFATDVLKVNRRHAAFRFKTKDLVKRNIFAGSKVSFTVYYFDVVDESWYAEEHKDVNCTGATGFGIQFSPTITEYLQFDVTESSKLKSLTLEIWTTTLW